MTSFLSSDLRIHGQSRWQQLPVGLFIVCGGAFVQVDDSLAERLGFRHASELIGRAVLDLVHPRDRAEAGVLSPTAQPVDVFDLALRFKLKDGGYFAANVQGGTVRHGTTMTLVGSLIEPAALGIMQNFVITGKSRSAQKVVALIEAVAETDATVLITGEHGTGKTSVALTIHQNGIRSAGPFTSVNGSALTEHTLEKLLIGVERGTCSDTGGHGQGEGKSGSGGTILLTEIADMSPPVQFRLFRILEEKRFGAGSQMAALRLLASSSKDLSRLVKIGEFRGDLHERLKAMEINLQPLRRRREDIPLLADQYSRFYSAWFADGVRGVSATALEHLIDYRWPGNGREMAHVMALASLRCRGQAVTEQHLPADLVALAAKGDVGKRSPLADNRSARSLRILDALNKALWNKTKAARYLGISRQTLYRQMKAYGMKPIEME